MKRNRKESRRREHALQAWSLEQAQQALPYVASLMRSLREHRLEWLALQQQARRLEDQPGRPNRTQLIALEEVRRATAEAAERFEEVLNDLHTLDIYCLDPIRGEALIPFIRDEQLAWFVFELFEGAALRSWRFHDDPLDMRRPLRELDDLAPSAQAM